jgi:hypothetical protein
MKKLLLSLVLMSTAAVAADTRVYELRTYYTVEGRLPALLARFRDHTTKLFEKHGMTNVGYWVPQNSKPERLIYILSFPSMEAAKKSWAAFRSDADWLKAKNASEASGKIVDRVESVYMDPADFSKLK